MHSFFDMFRPPTDAELRNAKLADERHKLAKNDEQLARITKRLELPGKLGEHARWQFVRRVNELLERLEEVGCFIPPDSISAGRWHLGDADNMPFRLTDAELLRGLLMIGPP